LETDKFRTTIKVYLFFVRVDAVVVAVFCY